MQQRTDAFVDILAKHGVLRGGSKAEAQRKLGEALSTHYSIEEFKNLAAFTMGRLGARSGARNPSAIFLNILQDHLKAPEDSTSELDDDFRRLPKPDVDPGASERKRNMEEKATARDKDEKEEPYLWRARVRRELWGLVVGDQKPVEHTAKSYNLTKDEAIDLLNEELDLRFPTQEEIDKELKKYEKTTSKNLFCPPPKYSSPHHREFLRLASKAKWCSIAEKKWRPMCNKHRQFMNKERKVTDRPTQDWDEKKREWRKALLGDENAKTKLQEASDG